MKSVFQVFKHGLLKTKTSLVRNIQSIFSDQGLWDDESYERLENALISADIGVDTSIRLAEDIKARYERGEISTAADILAVARQDLAGLMKSDGERRLELRPDSLNVILMVGVNGSGKTTTAAKLAHQWKSDGKSVMLAAGDTFRAAGIEQLKIWGERVGCPVIGGQQGGDAAALAYDAITAAKQRRSDVLIVDTAGRQHTSKALMDELAKVRRTIAKACTGAPHHVLLTVDASTGTNALLQAREFGRICEVTGLVLTKLDGTGKGGVVVPIRHELGYPVFFIGLGEKITDLQPFDLDLFCRAMFEE